MKLTEALQHHSGRELHLRHCDVAGTFIFNEDFELSFIADDGNRRDPPLYPSDFTRTDWLIAPIAED